MQPPHNRAHFRATEEVAGPPTGDSTPDGAPPAHLALVDAGGQVNGTSRVPACGEHPADVEHLYGLTARMVLFGG